MMYFIVLLGFGLFFLTMASGVMMGRKPIAGSCGGLAQVGLNGECKVCGKVPGSCDPDTLTMNTQVNTALVIDATQSVKATSDDVEQQDRLANRLKAPRFKDPLDF